MGPCSMARHRSNGITKMVKGALLTSWDTTVLKTRGEPMVAANALRIGPRLGLTFFQLADLTGR